MLLTLALGGCFAEVVLDPDQDDDGYTDLEEAQANTSYTDPMDKPYELGWQIDSCRWDVEGEGVGEGEVLASYSMRAQTNELVRLHDFCDQVVLIELGFYG